MIIFDKTIMRQFYTILKPKSDFITINKFFLYLLVFSFLLIFFILGLYFYKFHDSLSDTHNDWAIFGSFFGGVIGPIVTFISIIILILTIYIQNKDSSFKHQQDTFFKLLEFFMLALSEVSYTGKSDDVATEKKGEAAIKLFSVRLYKRLKRVEEKNILTLKNVEVEYAKFYHENKNSLGHIFRLSYNIIKYVDNSSLTQKEKEQYVSFLKALFSQAHLRLLFYNCLVGRGKTRYKILIEKYHFFDNLEFNEKGLSNKFKNEFAKNAYHSNSEIDD